MNTPTSTKKRRTGRNSSTYGTKRIKPASDYDRMGREGVAQALATLIPPEQLRESDLNADNAVNIMRNPPLSRNNEAAFRSLRSGAQFRIDHTSSMVE